VVQVGGDGRALWLVRATHRVADPYDAVGDVAARQGLLVDPAGLAVHPVHGAQASAGFQGLSQPESGQLSAAASNDMADAPSIDSRTMSA